MLKNHFIIPNHELEITTSRSGGPGGQHANKADTRITIHWNIQKSLAFNEEQKERLLQKLSAQLTAEGDIVIHNSASRSQEHNKKMAIAALEEKIRKALYVPKKRTPTHISKAIKTARLESKARHSAIKKMRSKRIIED